MDKDISTLLREVKAQTEWSEPQLAREIGVSQPTVNRILHGQNNCHVSTLRAIEELHKRVFAAPGEEVPADRQQDREAKGSSGRSPPDPTRLTT